MIYSRVRGKMSRTKGAKNRVSYDVLLLIAQVDFLLAEKNAWQSYSKTLLEIIIDSNINESEVKKWLEQ